MIALASAAIMMIETVSVRLYSFSLWYHMIPLIVGSAMIAFAAGTVFQYNNEWRVVDWQPQRLSWMPDTIWLLYLVLVWPIAKAFYLTTQALSTQQKIIRKKKIKILAIEGGLSLLVGLSIFSLELFAPSRVLTSMSDFAGFSAMVLSMALPYFFLGAIINIIFCSAEDKGGIYASDLAGSAIGALLGLAAIVTVGSKTGFALVAILAFSITYTKKPTWKRGVTCLALATGIIVLISGIHLPLYPGKSRVQIPSYSVAAQGKKSLGTKESLLSRLDIVSNTSNLKKANEINLIMDGSASTQIRRWDGNISSLAKTQNKLYSAPYQITEKGKVLIIGPGGGQEVRAALYFGNEIIGAEINPDIVQATRDTYGEWAGNLYEHPEVDIKVSEGRHFVSTSSDRFQVIQLSLIDTWAASASGAMSLSENTLYTVEAFSSYFSHLEKDGILAITRWHNTSQPLRVASVGWEALNRKGAENPGNHLVVIQDYPDTSEDQMTGQAREDMVLLKKTPWLKEELHRLEKVCEEKNWGIRYAPGYPSDEEFSLLAVRSTHDAFITSYSKNIVATTDDNPHFFQEERPEILLARLLRLGRGFGSGSSGTNTLIAAVLALGVLALGVIVIHFYLLRTKSKPIGVKRLTVFNALLGLGFMFVAIPLSQRISLVLSNPVVSFVLTFPVLILALGLGSYLTSLSKNRGSILIIGGVAILFGIVCLQLWGSLAEEAMLQWPLFQSIAVITPVVFLFGIPMGFFTPSGLKEAEIRGLSEYLPLFWGSNLAFSASASSIATFVSLLAGYSATFWIPAAIYPVATLVFLSFISQRGT